MYVLCREREVCYNRPDKSGFVRITLMNDKVIDREAPEEFNTAFADFNPQSRIFADILKSVSMNSGRRQRNESSP